MLTFFSVVYDLILELLSQFGKERPISFSLALGMDLPGARLQSYPASLETLAVLTTHLLLRQD